MRFDDAASPSWFTVSSGRFRRLLAREGQRWPRMQSDGSTPRARRNRRSRVPQPTHELPKLASSVALLRRRAHALGGHLGCRELVCGPCPQETLAASTVGRPVGLARAYRLPRADRDPHPFRAPEEQRRTPRLSPLLHRARGYEGSLATSPLALRRAWREGDGEAEPAADARRNSVGAGRSTGAAVTFCSPWRRYFIA